MSEQPDLQPCDPFSADLAELALGILTGRSRAATLAHVETCPRCADELEHLARAADAVLRVAPETEPPMGFETRLFSQMGVTAVPRTGRRRLQRSILAAAAVVAVLAVGLGVGWATGSHSPQTPSTVTAALVEHGHRVGHVIMTGGSKPWIVMDVSDSAAHGWVTCVVVTASGRVDTVGTFLLSQGYGAWGAPLHVTPSTVRRAEVLSASGAVIATAPLN
jgi:anti-sigma factor RsiW